MGVGYVVSYSSNLYSEELPGDIDAYVAEMGWCDSFREDRATPSRLEPLPSDPAGDAENGPERTWPLWQWQKYKKRCG